jgi:hypothetical protein
MSLEPFSNSSVRDSKVTTVLLPCKIFVGVIDLIILIAADSDISDEPKICSRDLNRIKIHHRVERK